MPRTISPRTNVIAKSIPDDPDRWIVLSAANPARAAGLAAVAAGLASSRRLGVLVVTVVPPSIVSLPQHDDIDPSAWPAVAVALEGVCQRGVPAGWLVCASADVGRTVRSIAAEVRASVIVLGWRGGARSDGEVLNATLKEVLQDPVADVVVVGGRVPSKLSRVLVPVGKGPHSQLALHLALDLAGRPSEGEATSGSSVTAIHIVPEARNGANGTKAQVALDAALGHYQDRKKVSGKVLVSDDTAQAILDELAAGYDLVVMGTSREALIDRLLFGDIPQRVAEESDVTVIVVRSHLSLVPRAARRGWHSLSDAMPSLTPSEQTEVRLAVAEGARWRVDFFTMLSLSAVLASLGLLLNSPAVIIGAMLVAPLMTAIVGLGLGTVEGDIYLLRTAAVSSLRGVLLAVAIGLILGLAIPGARPTAEILSRTQPNVLDLGVALASGAAGAYALCRKNVSAALAGVAIAAALVPPLATVGIGLGFGRWDIAGGASLLFATNLVAIAAASTVVFLLIGFAPPDTLKTRRRTFHRSLRGVGVLLAAIALILGWLTFHSLRTAQFNRDLTLVVRGQVASWPDAELVSFESESDPYGVLLVSIVVRSSDQPPYAAVQKLQNDLAGQLRQPVAITLDFVPTVHLQAVGPPDQTPSAASEP